MSLKPWVKNIWLTSQQYINKPSLLGHLCHLYPLDLGLGLQFPMMYSRGIIWSCEETKSQNYRLRDYRQENPGAAILNPNSLPPGVAVLVIFLSA